MIDKFTNSLEERVGKELGINAKGLWATACDSIKSCMSPETYASLFGDTYCDYENGKVLIYVSGKFAADWIRDNYSDIIRKNLCMAAGSNVDFDIVATDTNVSESEPLKDNLECDRKVVHSHRSFKKHVVAPVINPKNTFGNFVIGDSNQMAHAASLAVAKSPGSAFNPLCLYGSTGLGKTHLMHAIADFVFMNNPESTIVYTSSERFVNEFIKAIQDNDLIKFRKKYRDVDVLMIDDIQFFSGKERCQTEFFHTFNDLFESGKQIILSSDKHVSEIPELEQRLVSRFEWGMPIDIKPPDYETRCAILSKKSECFGIDIPSEVLDLIAKKITKNVRRLEGALNTVVCYVSLSGNKKIDVKVASDLLKDTFLQEENSQVIDIDFIQKKTADHFKIDVDEMKGNRRPANIAMARQVAMYISRKLTSHSLCEIGELFGGRNHGTVMHAIKTVSDTMEQEETIRRQVEFLIKNISANIG